MTPEQVSDEMASSACSALYEASNHELDAAYSEMLPAIAAAINASGCVLVKLDDGKLWSFLRSVLSQGGCIWADHQKSSAELYSARLDAAAIERATELRAMLSAEAPAAASSEREADRE